MDYLPRIGDSELRRLVAASPIVLVDGARATGKTTSCSRIVASEIRLPRDLALLQSDALGLIDSLDKPILIDEWQLAGVELLWTLKDMVDAHPAPGSFVLTGSVEPESYGPTYPLTGRASRVDWRPMNRREAMGEGEGPLWLDRFIAGEFFATSTAGEPTDIAVVSESGFPAALSIPESTTLLGSYVAFVAQRGLDDRRDPVRINALMRTLAELEALTVSDERVWRTAGVNRETLHRYDALLQRTHITQDARAWQTNRLKRLTSQRKRYFADTAMALAIAGITPDQLRGDPTLAGRYFDSYVAAQLRPEVDALGATMHHIRDKGGEHEIDILVDIAGKQIALEVKAGVRPTAADAKHLMWLKRRLGDSLIAAAVVHRGTSTWQLAPDIWAIPVSTMWT